MQALLRIVLILARGSIGVLYVGAGFFLILSISDPFGLEQPFRAVLGAVLLAYGIFRVWRAIKQRDIYV